MGAEITGISAMPIYEYRCEKCGGIFEELKSMSSPAPEKCSLCGASPVHRLVSRTSFVLKGSGWYATDYARKETGSGKDKETGGRKDKGGKDKGNGKDGGGNGKDKIPDSGAEHGEHRESKRPDAGASVGGAPSKPGAESTSAAK